MSNIPFNYSKAYALTVGVGNRDVDNPAMATTAKDANRIAKELVNRVHLPQDNVQIIINEDATAANILSGLDKIAASTKDAPAEMVFIYFSGHGCVKDDIYYIVSRDTVNTDVEHTAIAGSVFTEKLQAIQTDKLLILLDCCHSGGIYNPIDVPFDKDAVLAKPNRVIISASHASEVSYLSKPLSIFTYALVEGLAGKFFEGDDNEVSLFNLAMYLRERVYPLSENKQKPQLNILQQAQTSDFAIVRYPNGQPPAPAFDEDFSLMKADGPDAGKDINTGAPVVKDDDFRKQFNWILNVTGNDNTVIAGNTGTVSIKTVTQNAEKIVNVENMTTGNFNF